jgi:TRAP-type C4-dicarboxylate transport system permease small subunit
MDDVTTSKLPETRTGRILLLAGNAVSHAGLCAAAVALLAIVVINAANVIGRYFFRSPFSWAEEAMVFLMIMGVFAGSVSAAWNRAHIRIDAFLSVMPRCLRGALEGVTALITIAILLPIGIVSYQVTGMLLEFDQRSDALHLPVWIPQGAVPVALFLMVLMMAIRLVSGAAGASGHLMSCGDASDR